GLTTTQRGDYLYVSDTTTGSSLLGFQVGVTGVLTPVPGSPYSNISPSTLYLRTDATDAFLFTSSRALDHLRVYDIDGADGSLSEVSGSPFANPNPSGIVGPVLPYP
ncbi:MAG: beta-propeller fold lactonase family protein, partial [Planctomycetota bacterium]|nr:beta-propeller fold lactonase family protein [Planctomycetota bacterium]